MAVGSVVLGLCFPGRRVSRRAPASGVAIRGRGGVVAVDTGGKAVALFASPLPIRESAVSDSAAKVPRRRRGRRSISFSSTRGCRRSAHDLVALRSRKRIIDRSRFAKPPTAKIRSQGKEKGQNPKGDGKKKYGPVRVNVSVRPRMRDRVLLCRVWPSSTHIRLLVSPYT